MELMTQMLVPCVLAGTALYGTLRRVDVYGALVRERGRGWRPWPEFSRPWSAC